MAKRYQIVRYNGEKWSFVAHGARYTKAEAEATRQSIMQNSGDATRLLPVDG